MCLQKKILKYYWSFLEVTNEYYPDDKVSIKFIHDIPTVVNNKGHIIHPNVKVVEGTKPPNNNAAAAGARISKNDSSYDRNKNK